MNDRRPVTVEHDRALPEPSWHDTFVALHPVWEQIDPEPAHSDTDVKDWHRRFTRMQTEQQALQEAGRWHRDPTDLLTVCGVHRRELAHSAALAWLCDPHGDHGLAERFLSRLLQLTGDLPGLDSAVHVSTEVTRGTSRADVIVDGDAWTLLLELKVDAGESTAQCQRLFDHWRAEPSLRLLFITPTGRAPSTTHTAEAKAAWCTASWRHILDALDHAINDTDDAATGALAQYQQTLYRLYGRRTR